MRVKKAVLLFEVMLVIILVSVAGLFLFRGYSVFLKSGRKSLDYFRMALLAEEKIWDLYIKEKNGEAAGELEMEGDFDSQFSWSLALEDTDYQNLKKGFVTIRHRKRKKVHDTAVYLNVE